MIAIYKKEMRTYFTQMMGYIFLAFLLLLVGLWFVMMNVLPRDGNFHTVLNNVVVFFFILIPILTMRLFSEEAKNKTDQLLYTSPLSILGIVAGKYLAALSLFIIGVAVTIVLPFTASRFAELPVSQITGAYIGFVLLGAACIAIGVFVSVLTENQIIAAIATMGAIFVMFLIDMIAFSMPTSAFASYLFVVFLIIAAAGIWYNSTRNIITSVVLAVVGAGIALALYFMNNLVYDGVIVRTLLWFSIFARHSAFNQGVIYLSDVVYFVSFSTLFVYLTINVIEKRRWR